MTRVNFNEVLICERDCSESSQGNLHIADRILVHLEALLHRVHNVMTSGCYVRVEYELHFLCLAVILDTDSAFAFTLPVILQADLAPLEVGLESIRVDCQVQLNGLSDVHQSDGHVKDNVEKIKDGLEVVFQF